MHVFVRTFLYYHLCTKDSLHRFNLCFPEWQSLECKGCDVTYTKDSFVNNNVSLTSDERTRYKLWYSQSLQPSYFLHSDNRSWYAADEGLKMIIDWEGSKILETLQQVTEDDSCQAYCRDILVLIDSKVEIEHVIGQ